jgi:hypothetical protein
MARGKEITPYVLWCISRLGGEPLLNKTITFMSISVRYITNWYQSVVFVGLHCVALCLGILFSCCDL